MPPRISNTTANLCVSTCTSRICPPIQTAARCFSSTTRAEASAGKYKRPTRMRRQMNIWLHSRGAVFRDHKPNENNLLGAFTFTGTRKAVLRREQAAEENAKAGLTTQKGNGKEQEEETDFTDPTDLQPFPLNKDFVSQPVASEELREAVWSKVMKDGLSVSHVSAELGVEMNRVGAIVRLKEIEKEWIRKRLPLAKVYQKAVLSMLPQTKYPSNGPHESINDLPVHAATTVQLWHPTSESRQFTRADAAQVFLDGLLPADDRVPHPELHVLEKDRLAGVPREERLELAKQRAEEADALRAAKEKKKATWEKYNVEVIPQSRWDFKFTNISVEDAGKTGRGHRGVGARYGLPHEDRKRGQVKLPTRVE